MDPLMALIGINHVIFLVYIRKLILKLERNLIIYMLQRRIRANDFHIGTARFNNSTYQENIDWKKRKHWVGCCYGFDKKIATTINQGDYIFIIEMNNSNNKIMGIGLIRNIYIPKNRSRVYKSLCWNNFVYKSKYHISREQILLKKEKNKWVLLFLERILFYGNKHFKRGQGCTILSNNRIATFGNKIKKQTIYKCNKCGLPKKGHVCKGKRVARKIIEKKCRLCNKAKKGHICLRLKKNLKLVKVIQEFFKELFVLS